MSIKKILSLVSVGLLLASGSAYAKKSKLKLVEVITSPERTVILNDLLDGYRQSHPDVEIEVISLPWGQAFEKLATMVASGQAPDLVEMPDTWIAQYVASNRLVDLEPLLAKWSNTGQLTDKTLELARLGGAGDTAYMIPYGFYLRALFYNKKIFEEAGVKMPIETMDDYMAAAEKISKLDGKYAYCLRGGPGGKNSWLMMATTIAGNKDLFDENGQSTMNQPGFVKGLQNFIDIYQKGYAPKDSVNWGFNEVVAGFYSGTCATVDQDPDALLAIKERMSEEDFAVMPYPLGVNNTAYPTMGYTGWSIFKNSKNKDKAWDVIQHLSSLESNLIWSKKVGVIPIYKESAKDPFFATEQYSGWFTELNDPRWSPLVMPTYLKKFGYFSDILVPQSGQEALLGKKTAQELGDEWAELMTQEYSEWQKQQKK